MMAEFVSATESGNKLSLLSYCGPLLLTEK